MNRFDEALAKRMDYFSDRWDVLAADHGLDYVMYEPAADDKAIEDIFAKASSEETISGLRRT